MSKGYVNSLQDLASYIETMLDHLTGKHVGFCLLVFPFGEPPEEIAGMGADYVSNASREDMIKFLRETADRFEKNEVLGNPIGEV